MDQLSFLSSDAMYCRDLLYRSHISLVCAVLNPAQVGYASKFVRFQVCVEFFGLVRRPVSTKAATLHNLKANRKREAPIHI